MICVILESPYAGDIGRNTIYARRAIRHSLSLGEAPIASHLLYTQPGILDENIASERQWGIEAGHAWLFVADKMVLYTDYGISNGMTVAIARAKRLELPIEHRTIGENP